MRAESLHSSPDNPSYATGSILVLLPARHHLDCSSPGLGHSCLPGGGAGEGGVMKVRTVTSSENTEVRVL